MTIAMPAPITASSLPFAPLRRRRSRRFRRHRPLWRACAARSSCTPPRHPPSWPFVLLSLRRAWMWPPLPPLPRPSPNSSPATASVPGYGHESVAFRQLFAANKKSYSQANSVALRSPNYKLDFACCVSYFVSVSFASHYGSGTGWSMNHASFSSAFPFPSSSFLNALSCVRPRVLRGAKCQTQQTGPTRTPPLRARGCTPLQSTTQTLH
jgi:hypothetical protein